MSSGVFAVARNIFEHDLFAKEPYTEREAWIWLIKEAQWKARKVRVGRAVVSLKRGQCAYSTRFMASKWQWSEARVRRFLKRLKTDAMIDAVTDAHVTQITICNYDEYQRVSLPTDARHDAVNDAEATHSRRKEEDRENIKSKIQVSNETCRAAEPPASKPVIEKGPDAEAYRVGREVLGANAGGLVTKLKAYCDGDWLFVTDILRQAQAKDSPREWIGAVLRHGARPRTPKHILFPKEIYGGLLN